MHPMFAELFLTPEDTPEADARRRLRRTRRSRQLRTVSVARGKAGAAPAVLARNRTHHGSGFESVRPWGWIAGLAQSVTATMAIDTRTPGRSTPSLLTQRGGRTSG